MNLRNPAMNFPKIGERFRRLIENLIRFGSIAILMILLGCGGTEEPPETRFQVTFVPHDPARGAYTRGWLYVNLQDPARRRADGDFIKSAELTLFGHKIQTVYNSIGLDGSEQNPLLFFDLPATFNGDLYRCGEGKYLTLIAINLNSGRKVEVNFELCPDRLQQFSAP